MRVNPGHTVDSDLGQRDVQFVVRGAAVRPDALAGGASDRYEDRQMLGHVSLRGKTCMAVRTEHRGILKKKI